MRGLELLDGLIEGGQPSRAQDHNADDAGVDGPLAPVAERVLGRGFAAAPLASEHELHLVHRVGGRVNGFALAVLSDAKLVKDIGRGLKELSEGDTFTVEQVKAGMRLTPGG